MPTIYRYAAFFKNFISVTLYRILATRHLAPDVCYQEALESSLQALLSFLGMCSGWQSKSVQPWDLSFFAAPQSKPQIQGLSAFFLKPCVQNSTSNSCYHFFRPLIQPATAFEFELPLVTTSEKKAMAWHTSNSATQTLTNKRTRLSDRS